MINTVSKLSLAEALKLSKELSPATALSAGLSYLLTLVSDLPQTIAIVSIASISVTVHLLSILLKARLREREREIRTRHEMANRLGIALLIVGHLNAICKDVPPQVTKAVDRLIESGVYGDSELGIHLAETGGD
jgi:hypothetical protein